MACRRSNDDLPEGEDFGRRGFVPHRNTSLLTQELEQPRESREVIAINTADVAASIPEAEEKSTMIATVIAQSTTHAQSKVMFVQPPHSSDSLSEKPTTEIRPVTSSSAPIPIPSSSRYSTREPHTYSMSCPSRFIDVKGHDQSFVISRVNRQMKDGKFTHVIGESRPHSEIEYYVFNRKLNKLTITNTSSIEVYLPGSIYGVEVIFCSDVKIITTGHIHIRAEHSQGISIKGSATISAHHCMDILHNDTIVRANVFTSEGFASSLPSAFVRTNELTEEEIAALGK